MAQELRFQLLGDSSDLQKAFSEGVGSAEAMEATLGDLRGQLSLMEEGQVAFNEATQRYVDASGNFVSSAEGQERVLEELRSMGIRTEEGLQEQVATLERLKGTVEEGGVAYGQLADRQQRLQTELAEVGEAAAQQNRDLSRLDNQFSEATVEMSDFARRQDQLQQELQETARAQRQMGEAAERTGGHMDAVSGPASEVGFILQDMQQFQFGAAAGFRSIGNNLPGLISGFRRVTASGASLASMFTGPAGILIGVNALAGALPFLVEKLTDTSSAMDEAGESASSADQDFEGFLNTTQQLNEDLPQLEVAAENVQQKLESLSAPGVEEIAPDGDISLGGDIINEEEVDFSRVTGAESVINRITREIVRAGESGAGNIEDQPVPEGLREAQRQALQSLRSAIRGTSEEAIALRAALRQVKEVDVGAILEGSFKQAQQEIAASNAEIVSVFENTEEALNQPEVFATELRNTFSELQSDLQQEQSLGLASELDAAERKVQFLEQGLKEAQSAFDLSDEEFQAQFGPQIQQLEQARQRAEDLKNETEDTAEVSEEIVQAQRRITSAIEQGIIAREEAKPLVEDLGTSNDQIARSTAEALGNVEDLRAQLTDLAGPQGKALAQARRTKEQFQRQVEALQNVNRILARRDSGIQAEQVMPAGPGSLGETPPVLQSIQELSGQSNVLQQYAQRLREARIQAQGLNQALQDTELAGSDRGLGQGPEDGQAALQQTPGLGAASSSIEEIQNQFDVGEEQARQFKNQAKQQIGQVITAASQLGSALGQAFSDGEKNAKDFVSIALQGVGGVLSAIPGVGQVSGPLLGGIGSIVGSFEEGGAVRGPGGPTEDQIPAMLSDKEFVVQAASAQMAPGALQAMNEDPALAGVVEQLVTSQEVKQFASGGMVEEDSMPSATAEGGEVRGEGEAMKSLIPAMLSDKKFVMRAASAQEAPELLQVMNDDPAVAQGLKETLTGMAPASQGGGRQATIAGQTAALGPLEVGAKKLAEDGKVRGKGRTTEDRIPALLSDRESVMQAEPVIQAPMAMEAMNEDLALATVIEQLVAGSPEQFATGGFAITPVADAAIAGDGTLISPFQEGGLIRGEGGPTDDQIPAMLSDKEYVVQAASAQMAPEALQAINEDPALAGMVEEFVTAHDIEQFASGGMVGAGSMSGVTAEAVFAGQEPEEFASGGLALDGHTASHNASVKIMEQKAAREMTVEIEEQGRLQSNMDRLRADIDRNAEFKGR